MGVYVVVTKMDEFYRACEKGNLLKVKSMVERGHDVNKKDEKDYLWYRTPLMYAAGEGRFDVVKYLINHGADVSKTNFFEQTALHHASEYGHLKVVELLLSKGAGIDVEDTLCHTPLTLAARTGLIAILLCLINHGVDLNKRNVHKRTALHYAIECGHLEVLELLLSKGAGIDVEDEDGHAPLTLAAKKGRSDILLCLINHGADLDKTNVHKRTALHYASEYGHLEVVELLLSKGAGIDVEDKDDHTSLTLAAKTGRSDILLCLINHGADLNKTNVHKRTALHYASEYGHLEVVELLLSKGAGIDVEDKDGHTPLTLAAKTGRSDILLCLINHGADLNKTNVHKRTVLHYAIECGHLKVVELLLSKGAEIDVEDEDGHTPLMLAAKTGRSDILLCLINQGADLNKTNVHKRTALHYASEYGHLEVVELLLSKGAGIDVEDKDGHTPLTLAAKKGRSDILLCLINQGADLNKTNVHKRTALHYASEYGHLEVVELLLSKDAGLDVEDKLCHTLLTLAAKTGRSYILLCLINQGADLNKRNVDKRTALHYAIECGHLKVVELLLSKGAEIDLEDEDGHTPLMLAAKTGRSDILLCLINQGADLNKTNVQKRTALHYASEYGHLEVVELLLSKGAGLDVEDKLCHTLLTLAAKTGRSYILLCLINHGADLNKTNVHKRTALHYASEYGHLEVVELLLSKGAGIDVEDEDGHAPPDKDRYSPLMLAGTNRHFDVVCHLIAAGASVKQLADNDNRNLGKEVLSYGIRNNHMAAVNVLITNNVGIEGELCINPPRTALMWCAENGHDSVVKLLILKGVYADCQNANGDTALHFAAHSNHIQCGILLVEAGASVRLRNKASATPLAVASIEFKDAVMQTLSFNTKKTVCVIGNAYSGKSTLIASLQNENANLLTKLRHRLFGVKNISQRTAGIEQVSLSSKRYGDVVFFDFAGQHEYHGPHEMFLESILSKSKSTLTIIVVVNVTEEESAISQQLDQWLHIASKMSPSTNPICVIVIGSHMDEVKSKAAAKEKLECCYERVRQSLRDVPLKFHDACYLDCRQPYQRDIERLCTYLNEVPIPEYKATKMPYSICWVIFRMKTSLDSKAIRVEDFTEWIEGNKANLPTNLPPAEEVCKDLSSTGHFLYLSNKEDPSNGWLVLDLPSILHEVYGTLFSPSKKIVNKFGLLSCRKFSVLFNTLDQEMVRNILISLEFCIEVDPSILAEELTQLTESTDKDHEHLFFPALISLQPPKVFTCTQEGCHVLSWQLVVDRKPFISPRLLQTIILRLAAHHVILYKRGFHTREHCCRVWSTGIFWQTTDGHNVAVQITDNTVVEVIGSSKAGPEVLCSYISTITQDIFATIRELSPTLSATAYIIHPADPQVLLENPRSPCPQEKFPVEVILESTRNGRKFCLSCMTENRPALNPSITEVFCGFEPSEEVVHRLYFVNGTCEFECECEFECDDAFLPILFTIHVVLVTSCVVLLICGLITWDIKLHFFALFVGVIDTEHVTGTCVDPHPGLTTPPETSEATANTKTQDTALYDQPMHRGRCVHVLYIL